MAATEQIEQDAPEIQELRARASSAPNELEPLLELGWALYGRDQTTEALEQLEEAKKRFPDNPDVYYALGLAYKRTGDKQKARAAFEQAVDHLPEAPDNVRSSMLLRLSKRQLNML